MKIIGVKTSLKNFQLRHPSSVAYAVNEQAQNLIVRLDTDDGLIGWGVCAPDPYVTGDTAEQDQQFIETVARDFLLEADYTCIAYIHNLLKKNGEAFPGALAGINIALYDLLGKKAGLPVYQLLGACRHSFLTSITIGLWQLDDAINVAREYLNMGFRCFKIKIGETVAADSERVIRINEVMQGKYPLRLDANQAYNVEQTLHLIDRLKTLPIEFIEQPTPQNDLESLGLIKARSTIPIMADESARSIKESFQLLKSNLVDLINIKLMKTGGLVDAIKLDALAEAAAVPTMVGCMDESSISIAAALHFALSRSNVHFVDLDGHIDIIDDVATEALQLIDGMLIPSSMPGFGFKVSL